MSKDCIKLSRKKDPEAIYQHGDCLIGWKTGISHSYSKSEKKDIECQPNY